MAEIIVDYNGNFADRMQWNEKKLAEFARVSDLRTKITIVDGDEYPRASVTEIGDTLAWKRFSPLDFFRKREAGNLSEVSDEGNAEATIFLNHHIITQDVMQRYKGRVDEKLVAKQINDLVKGGLLEITAKEKLLQTFGSLLIDGVLLTGSGVFLGAAAFFVFGEPLTNINIFIRDSIAHVPESDDFVRFATATMVKLGELGVAGYAIKASLTYLNKARQKLNDDPIGEYFTSARDYNLFKHPANLIAGNIYLATAGRQLVTAK